MFRRADPLRIQAARRAAAIARLISAGELPDRAAVAVRLLKRQHLAPQILLCPGQQEVAFDVEGLDLVLEVSQLELLGEDPALLLDPEQAHRGFGIHAVLVDCELSVEPLLLEFEGLALGREVLRLLAALAGDPRELQLLLAAQAVLVAGQLLLLDATLGCQFRQLDLLLGLHANAARRGGPFRFTRARGRSDARSGSGPTGRPATSASGQLPQGATFRQFGTTSLTVWVPVAP